MLFIMRIWGIFLIATLGCTSPVMPVVDAGLAWQQQLLAADSLDIGWTNVEGSPPRKVITGADLASVKQFFARPLTDQRLLCMVHIDASIRVKGGSEVFLCFGCGTIVVDKKEWNRVEKEQMRALFTQLLGPRPKEPDDTGY